VTGKKFKKKNTDATEWIATVQFITRKIQKSYSDGRSLGRVNESSMCVGRRVGLIRWPEQRGRRRSRHAQLDMDGKRAVELDMCVPDVTHARRSV